MASLPDLFLAQAQAASNLAAATDALNKAVDAYEDATIQLANGLAGIKAAMAQVQSL